MFIGIYCPGLSAEVSLSHFAYEFSPLVEENGPGLVVIDVDGCELLFGSAYRLANEIVARASKARDKFGKTLNVALASNPDTAIHAAKNLKGITFVAPGEELTCLGDFTLEVLDHSLVDVDQKRTEEILETLKLWGVNTFRDFACLPMAGMSERLGQEGIRLQRLASGKTERNLRLKQAPPVFESSIELEFPIAELEPLSFIFARLLNQICASLNSYALASNELLVQMQLEDQSTHERNLTLPYPMRDHKVFLKLLLLDTEMHPPQSAVKAISIHCEPVKPRVLQNGLFTPVAPAPDKLELTLARLGKLVGQNNIGSPVLRDTHRPDAFSMNRFILKIRDTGRRRSRTANPQLAIGTRQCLGFRSFRPPLRAVVEVESGRPKQVSAWGKTRSVYGKVVDVAGPWRTSGDWWRDDRWARDEWDVSLESVGKNNDGANLRAVYRIYKELASGNWFIDGNYD